jgi:hypothetical protein
MKVLREVVMKNTYFTARVACAALALLALSACQDVKKELGVGRNSPDEFMVVKRAPLTLPPDYDLRPPAQGSTPPAADASNQVKTLMGAQDADAANAPKGTAEQEILQKMGADKANPDIRTVISQENGYLAVKNQALVDKLIFWNNDQSAEEDNIPDSVVNAKAEAERLKKNQQEGKPVNAGNVPVIEHKKSTLDKIF